jgi:FtsH-binding integral membrane protein
MWTAEELELTKCCLLNMSQRAACPEDEGDIIICAFYLYLFFIYLFTYLFIYFVFSDTEVN